MPTSAPEGKEFIKDWVSKQDIKTILDIGAGEGTYRKLLGPNYHWIAVEVFEPYIEQYGLRDLYDEILNENARVMELPNADLIICGDVLEHMFKDDVDKFLEKCKKFKHMIVSIPLGDWPQDAVNGNIFETHLHSWTMRQGEETFNFPIKRQEGQIGIFIR